MPLILQDRVAIVTGGDSGIGAACTAALAAAGAHVATIFHSDEQKSEETATAARKHGVDALSIQCDVGDEGAVDAAFDEVNDKLGLPSILVNSAGINMAGIPVMEMDAERWRLMLGTDLTGTFLTSRRFARDLTRAGGDGAPKEGAIVNITSIHSFAMRAGGADYCAAKGGQANFTRTMAIELADKGVTVNAIAPGMILTPMNERAMEDEDYRRSLTENIPMKRAGSPAEIAEMALFLAGPSARYITGAEIVIDGGLSLLVGQGA